MTTIRNWSGSVSFTPSAVHTPRSSAEVAALVRQAQKVRVIGSGHSFTPLIATDHTLISLDALQGIDDIDGMHVTVHAGTKIKALGSQLYRNRLAQQNLGDINVQSIAGAISTGTHGTGVNFGGLATQVTGLTLVTGDGSFLHCSNDNAPDIFKAAQVSLGALGIITSLTLLVVPSYRLSIELKKSTLAHTLADLEHLKSANRHFEFYWIPHTDTVQLRLTNQSTEPAQGHTFSRWFNETVLENGVVWLFSAFARAFPSASAGVARTLAALISPSRHVNHAHEVFASKRLVKFQEMEYNLPAAAFPTVIKEIAQAIERERIQVHFPVECRFAQGDDIDLSPAFGRDSAYIAVHMFRGMAYRSYFDRVEAIFKAHDGRPHWGKLHTRTAADLEPLYPRWHAFQAARNRCDPNRVFTTPYLETVLGP